ncbi:MAG: hypothetical protein GF401_17730 [Chitinivibrionales bacterium]|nr:hypothetical protein [Chitinivibrionales bacterium]
MFPTYQAEVKKGKINLPDDTKLPDGTKVLVTVISDDELRFWSDASTTSLDKIWNNEEDDAYAQLLSE